MTRSTRSKPAQASEVKSIPIPLEAARRILTAVSAAQQALAHSSGIIEAVQAALGAPPGSQLVQTQDDGALYFIPPAAPEAQEG